MYGEQSLVSVARLSIGRSGHEFLIILQNLWNSVKWSHFWKAFTSEVGNRWNSIKIKGFCYIPSSSERELERGAPKGSSLLELPFRAPFRSSKECSRILWFWWNSIDFRLLRWMPSRNGSISQNFINFAKLWEIHAPTGRWTIWRQKQGTVLHTPRCMENSPLFLSPDCPSAGRGMNFS